jgi:hypothetical protein
MRGFTQLVALPDMFEIVFILNLFPRVESPAI